MWLASILWMLYCYSLMTLHATNEKTSRLITSKYPLTMATSNPINYPRYISNFQPPYRRSPSSLSPRIITTANSSQSLSQHATSNSNLKKIQTLNLCKSNQMTLLEQRYRDLVQEKESWKEKYELSERQLTQVRKQAGKIRELLGAKVCYFFNFFIFENS